MLQKEKQTFVKKFVFFYESSRVIEMRSKAVKLNLESDQNTEEGGE